MAEQNNKLKKDAGPTDHLANERTFLAWIRTAIALIGLGFVIVKFALFIRQITSALNDQQVQQSHGISVIIGVFMVAVGAIMTVLAYFRYRNIEKHLENNEYYPSKWLSAVLTFFILAGSIFLLLYLLRVI
jgi:putative membrane protein